MTHTFKQDLLCTERGREHAWEMFTSAPPLLQSSALKIGERSSIGTGGNLSRQKFPVDQPQHTAGTQISWMSKS